MKALGMIEVIGFCNAVLALDVAAKAARIELIKIEKTGGGLVSVLIEGDVASVAAALEAVQATGAGVKSEIIASPHEKVTKLLT